MKEITPVTKKWADVEDNLHRDYGTSYIHRATNTRYYDYHGNEHNEEGHTSGRVSPYLCHMCLETNVYHYNLHKLLRARKQ
jgi:hypothetical protein